MPKISPAPIVDPVVEGFEGKARLSWILFFQNVVNGDVGTIWSPIAVNLAATGTPTITGTYYQNQGWTDFWIRIVPATDTTATAGSTYFELPFDVIQDAPGFAVTGLTGGVGMIDGATNRIYPPAWSAVTVPVTLTGRVFTG